MASLLNRLWSRADFWDKEENEKQKQQFAAQTRAQSQPRPVAQTRPAQKINDNTPGFQWSNNSLTRGLSRGFDQLNPFDNNRTWQQRTPTDTLSLVQEAKQKINTPSQPDKYWSNGIGKTINTGMAGTMRAAAGVGQDTAGLYDLLTPGKGTNRVTKYFKNRGAMWDEKAKEAGVDGMGYHVAQAPLTVASYMVPGKAVKAASAVPRVAKAVSVASNVLEKAPGVAKATGYVDDLVANGNRLQRVGGKLLQSYRQPSAILDVVGDALQNAGHRTSLGQDNSLGTAMQDMGLSLGMQGGVNLLGQAASPVLNTTTRLAKNTINTIAPQQTTTRLVKRPGRLDLQTADLLKAYSDRIVGADPSITGRIESDLIRQVRQIGDELGVDLTNGTPVDQLERIEAILNGYLPQQQTARRLALQPLNEGGYARNPFYRGDDVAGGKNVDPLESLKQEAGYRSAHQIDSKTARNLGDMQSVDDVVAQIKSKYGLTNYDQKDITNLKKIVGNPEADVKIYRASPVNELNDGDWVTTSKTYANDIKRQNGGRAYEYTVKAKELNLPQNIEDNPSLARFSAFQYKKATQPAKSPIESLKQEARKYKSAEEFVKAKTNAYHGTDKVFDQFDPKKAGSSMKMDKYGTFFTDDANRAKVWSATYPQKPKYRWTPEDHAQAEKAIVMKAFVDDSDALTLQEVKALYDSGKIKTKPQTDGLFRPESYFDNNRESIKEAMDVTGKKVFKARAEGQTHYAVDDSSKMYSEKQLTDLYNQANKKGLFTPLNDSGSAEVGGPLIPIPKKMQEKLAGKDVRPDPLESLKQEAKARREAQGKWEMKFREKAEKLSEPERAKLREKMLKDAEKDLSRFRSEEAINADIKNFKLKEKPDETTSAEVSRIVKESFSQNDYDPNSIGYFVDLTPENIKNVKPLKGIEQLGDTVYVDTKAGISEVKIQDWSSSGQGFRVSNGNGNEIARFNTREEAVEFAKKALTIENEAARQGKRVILNGSRTEPRNQATQSQPPKSTPKAEAPDPLESLKQEARKYKSAEEFVQANNGKKILSEGGSEVTVVGATSDGSYVILNDGSTKGKTGDLYPIDEVNSLISRQGELKSKWESNRKFIAEQDAIKARAEAAKEAKTSAKKDLKGFTDNMTQVGRGRVESVLDKKVNLQDYGIVTRREKIELLVRDGYEISDTGIIRKPGKQAGYTSNKTEADYFKYLKSSQALKESQPKARPEDVPSYVPDDKIDAYLKSDDYKRDLEFKRMADETKSGDPFDHPDMYENPTPEIRKNLKAPQPTKKPTPFEKDLQAAGLAPTKQTKQVQKSPVQSTESAPIRGGQETPQGVQQPKRTGSVGTEIPAVEAPKAPKQKAGPSVQSLKNDTTKIKITQKGGTKKVTVGKVTLPDDLVGDVNQWKDVGSTLKTMDRNIEAAAPNETQYRKIHDFAIEPRGRAVTAMVDETAKIKSELKDAVKQYGLKDKSVRADVMRFGEKKIKYSELVEKYGKQKADNIKAADKWFRGQYDRLLEETNAVLRKFNQPEIPRRANYYTHFSDDNLWASVGLKIKQIGQRGDVLQETGGQAIRGQGIDPKLLGQSEFTTPNKKWNPFAQQRKGDKTKYDAVEAFERYLLPTLHNKHLTESVVKTRMVTKAFQDATAETKHLPTFIRQLQEYGNNLAGKTNRFDRPLLETKWGSRALNTTRYMQQQMGRNTILGSVRSAIMQTAALPLSIKEAGLKNTALGLMEEVGSKVRGKDAAQMSDFLRRRYANFDSVLPSKLRKAENAAGYVFEQIEQTTTKGIWRASHRQAIEGGLSGKAAIKEADRITERLVGGRQIGERAEAFRSVLGNTAMQFQLEVNNFMQEVAKDAANKDAKKLLKLFAATYAFNALVYEPLVGDKPLPDPVDAAMESFENLKNGNIAGAIGRMPAEVLSNVPGGSLVAGLYPEYGASVGGTKLPTRKKLFGDTEAGRYGGSLAALGTLQNPEYLIPKSFGLKQVDRTIGGVRDWMQGENKSNKDKQRFEIEQSAPNALRAALLGSYGTNEGKAYLKEQSNKLRGIGKDEEESNLKQIGTSTTKDEKGNILTRDKYDAVINAYTKNKQGLVKVTDYDNNQFRSVINEVKNDLSSELKQAGLRDLAKVDSRHAVAYAKYRKSIEGKDELEVQRLSKNFYRKSYLGEMDKRTQAFYGLSDDAMRTALQNGKVSKDQLAKAVEIDNYLTETGLQRYYQIGKKLRAELGIAGGSTGRSGGRGGGRKSRLAFEPFKFGKKSSHLNKELRALIEEAGRSQKAFPKAKKTKNYS